MEGGTPPRAAVSARNSFVTRRTSFTRSVTASFRYRRAQCVWTVYGEMLRLTAMANSVWSLNTPCTIWNSRCESLRLQAISRHAFSENIPASAGYDFRLKGAEVNANLSPPRSGNDLAFPIFPILPFASKPQALLICPRKTLSRMER